MTAGDTARRYRFTPIRRSGLFGALPPTLVVTLAAGVLTAWALVITRATLPLAVAPIAAAGAVAFGRIAGRPVHEVIPVALCWSTRILRRRHRWVRPVPLLVDGTTAQALPPALAGLTLFEATPPGSGRTPPVGVVHDRTAGLLTAVLRVYGDGQFALADPAGQDHQVDLWGLALGAFCRESTPVARIVWHESTSPTGIGDHAARARTRWGDEPDDPARASYVELIDAVTPASVRHDVLVEVTIDLRKLRTLRRRPSVQAGTEILLDEVRLFTARLEHAGLHPSLALTAVEVITITRVLSDPTTRHQLATRQRSLAAATSHAAPEFGPMAVHERWGHVQVDAVAHRSWVVARWPRRETPADWLGALLFGLDGTRTVTVVFEPVAPSRSDRDIDKEAVTRETNADDKARRGFRVKAVDRKAARDVERREAELNDGYPELAYTGLLTVTAATVDELDDLAGTVEQTAAQAGIELRVLYASQAAGWVAGLPLGRNLARKVNP